MSWSALKRITPCASAATDAASGSQVAALAAQFRHQADSLAVCAGPQGKRVDHCARIHEDVGLDLGDRPHFLDDPGMRRARAKSSR